MKTLLFLVLILLTVGCGINPDARKAVWERQGFRNYNEYVIYQINHLKRPVVLYGVVYQQHSKNYTILSITLKDGKDSLVSFNDCYISEIIATYEVGDVVVK